MTTVGSLASVLRVLLRLCPHYESKPSDPSLHPTNVPKIRQIVNKSIPQAPFHNLNAHSHHNQDIYDILQYHIAHQSHKRTTFPENKSKNNEWLNHSLFLDILHEMRTIPQSTLYSHQNPTCFVDIPQNTQKMHNRSSPSPPVFSISSILGEFMLCTPSQSLFVPEQDVLQTILKYIYSNYPHLTPTREDPTKSPSSSTNIHPGQAYTDVNGSRPPHIPLQSSDKDEQSLSKSKQPQHRRHRIKPTLQDGNKNIHFLVPCRQLSSEVNLFSAEYVEEHCCHVTCSSLCNNTMNCFPTKNYTLAMTRIPLTMFSAWFLVLFRGIYDEVLLRYMVMTLRMSKSLLTPFLQSLSLQLFSNTRSGQNSCNESSCSDIFNHYSQSFVDSSQINPILSSFDRKSFLKFTKNGILSHDTVNLRHTSHQNTVVCSPSHNSPFLPLFSTRSTSQNNPTVQPNGLSNLHSICSKRTLNPSSNTPHYILNEPLYIYSRGPRRDRELLELYLSSQVLLSPINCAHLSIDQLPLIRQTCDLQLTTSSSRTQGDCYRQEQPQYIAQNDTSLINTTDRSSNLHNDMSLFCLLNDSIVDQPTGNDDDVLTRNEEIGQTYENGQIYNLGQKYEHDHHHIIGQKYDLGPEQSSHWSCHQTSSHNPCITGVNNNIDNQSQYDLISNFKPSKSPQKSPRIDDQHEATIGTHNIHSNDNISCLQQCNAEFIQYSESGIANATTAETETKCVDMTKSTSFQSTIAHISHGDYISANMIIPPILWGGVQRYLPSSIVSGHSYIPFHSAKSIAMPYHDISSVSTHHHQQHDHLGVKFPQFTWEHWLRPFTMTFTTPASPSLQFSSLPQQERSTMTTHQSLSPSQSQSRSKLSHLEPPPAAAAAANQQCTVSINAPTVLPFLNQLGRRQSSSSHPQTSPAQIKSSSSQITSNQHTSSFSNIFKSSDNIMSHIPSSQESSVVSSPDLYQKFHPTVVSKKTATATPTTTPTPTPTCFDNEIHAEVGNRTDKSLNSLLSPSPSSSLSSSTSSTTTTSDSSSSDSSISSSDDDEEISPEKQHIPHSAGPLPPCQAYTYIAAQAPCNTEQINAFWQMIYEQRIGVVSILSHLTTAYWPTIAGQKQQQQQQQQYQQQQQTKNEMTSHSLSKTDTLFVNETNIKAHHHISLPSLENLLIDENDENVPLFSFSQALFSQAPLTLDISSGSRIVHKHKENNQIVRKNEEELEAPDQRIKHIVQQQHRAEDNVSDCHQHTPQPLAAAQLAILPILSIAHPTPRISPVVTQISPTVPPLPADQSLNTQQRPFHVVKTATGPLRTNPNADSGCDFSFVESIVASVESPNRMYRDDDVYGGAGAGGDSVGDPIIAEQEQEDDDDDDDDKNIDENQTEQEQEYVLNPSTNTLLSNGQPESLGYSSQTSLLLTPQTTRKSSHPDSSHYLQPFTPGPPESSHIVITARYSAETCGEQHIQQQSQVRENTTNHFPKKEQQGEQNQQQKQEDQEHHDSIEEFGQDLVINTPHRKQREINIASYSKSHDMILSSAYTTKPHRHLSDGVKANVLHTTSKRPQLPLASSQQQSSRHRSALLQYNQAHTREVTQSNKLDTMQLHDAVQTDSIRHNTEPPSVPPIPSKQFISVIPSAAYHQHQLRRDHELEISNIDMMASSNEDQIHDNIAVAAAAVAPPPPPRPCRPRRPCPPAIQSSSTAAHPMPVPGGRLGGTQRQVQQHMCEMQDEYEHQQQPQHQFHSHIEQQKHYTGHDDDDDDPHNAPSSTQHSSLSAAAVAIPPSLPLLVVDNLYITSSCTSHYRNVGGALPKDTLVCLSNNVSSSSAALSTAAPEHVPDSHHDDTPGIINTNANMQTNTNNQSHKYMASVDASLQAAAAQSQQTNGQQTASTAPITVVAPVVPKMTVPHSLSLLHTSTPHAKDNDDDDDNDDNSAHIRDTSCHKFSMMSQLPSLHIPGGEDVGETFSVDCFVPQASFLINTDCHSLSSFTPQHETTRIMSKEPTLSTQVATAASATAETAVATPSTPSKPIVTPPIHSLPLLGTSTSIQQSSQISQDDDFFSYKQLFQTKPGLSQLYGAFRVTVDTISYLFTHTVVIWVHVEYCGPPSQFESCRSAPLTQQQSQRVVLIQFISWPDTSIPVTRSLFEYNCVFTSLRRFVQEMTSYSDYLQSLIQSYVDIALQSGHDRGMAPEQLTELAATTISRHPQDKDIGCCTQPPLPLLTHHIYHRLIEQWPTHLLTDQQRTKIFPLNLFETDHSILQNNQNTLSRDNSILSTYHNDHYITSSQQSSFQDIFDSFHGSSLLRTAAADAAISDAPSHFHAHSDSHHHRSTVIAAPHAPILVHCHAGIGRTGCFIACDILINNIIAIINAYLSPYIAHFTTPLYRLDMTKLTQYMITQHTNHDKYEHIQQEHSTNHDIPSNIPLHALTFMPETMISSHIRSMTSGLSTHRFQRFGSFTNPSLTHLQQRLSMCDRLSPRPLPLPLPSSALPQKSNIVIPMHESHHLQQIHHLTTPQLPPAHVSRQGIERLTPTLRPTFHHGESAETPMINQPFEQHSHPFQPSIDTVTSYGSPQLAMMQEKNTKMMKENTNTNCAISTTRSTTAAVTTTTTTTIVPTVLPPTATVSTKPLNPPLATLDSDSIRPPYHHPLRRYDTTHYDTSHHHTIQPLIPPRRRLSNALFETSNSITADHQTTSEHRSHHHHHLSSSQNNNSDGSSRHDLMFEEEQSSNNSIVEHNGDAIYCFSVIDSISDHKQGKKYQRLSRRPSAAVMASATGATTVPPLPPSVELPLQNEIKPFEPLDTFEYSQSLAYIPYVSLVGGKYLTQLRSSNNSLFKSSPQQQQSQLQSQQPQSQQQQPQQNESDSIGSSNLKKDSSKSSFFQHISSQTSSDWLDSLSSSGPKHRQNMTYDSTTTPTMTITATGTDTTAATTATTTAMTGGGSATSISSQRFLSNIPPPPPVKPTSGFPSITHGFDHFCAAFSEVMSTFTFDHIDTDSIHHSSLNDVDDDQNDDDDDNGDYSHGDLDKEHGAENNHRDDSIENRGATAAPMVIGGPRHQTSAVRTGVEIYPPRTNNIAPNGLKSSSRQRVSPHQPSEPPLSARNIHKQHHQRPHHHHHRHHQHHQPHRHHYTMKYKHNTAAAAAAAASISRKSAKQGIMMMSNVEPTVLSSYMYSLKNPPRSRRLSISRNDGGSGGLSSARQPIRRRTSVVSQTMASSTVDGGFTETTSNLECNFPDAAMSSSLEDFDASSVVDQIDARDIVVTADRHYMSQNNDDHHHNNKNNNNNNHIIDDLLHSTAQYQQQQQVQQQQAQQQLQPLLDHHRHDDPTRLSSQHDPMQRLQPCGLDLPYLRVPQCHGSPHSPLIQNIVLSSSFCDNMNQLGGGSNQITRGGGSSGVAGGGSRCGDQHAQQLQQQQQHQHHQQQQQHSQLFESASRDSIPDFHQHYHHHRPSYTAAAPATAATNFDLLSETTSVHNCTQWPFSSNMSSTLSQNTVQLVAATQMLLHQVSHVGLVQDTFVAATAAAAEPSVDPISSNSIRPPLDDDHHSTTNQTRVELMDTRRVSHQFDWQQGDCGIFEHSLHPLRMTTDLPSASISSVSSSGSLYLEHGSSVSTRFMHHHHHHPQQQQQQQQLPTQQQAQKEGNNSSINSSSSSNIDTALLPREVHSQIPPYGRTIRSSFMAPTTSAMTPLPRPTPLRDNHTAMGFQKRRCSTLSNIFFQSVVQQQPPIDGIDHITPQSATPIASVHHRPASNSASACTTATTTAATDAISQPIQPMLPSETTTEVHRQTNDKTTDGSTAVPSAVYPHLTLFTGLSHHPSSSIQCISRSTVSTWMATSQPVITPAAAADHTEQQQQQQRSNLCLISSPQHHHSHTATQEKECVLSKHMQETQLLDHNDPQEHAQSGGELSFQMCPPDLLALDVLLAPTDVFAAPLDFTDTLSMLTASLCCRQSVSTKSNYGHQNQPSFVHRDNRGGPGGRPPPPCLLQSNNHQAVLPQHHQQHQQSIPSPLFSSSSTRQSLLLSPTAPTISGLSSLLMNTATSSCIPSPPPRPINPSYPTAAVGPRHVPDGTTQHTAISSPKLSIAATATGGGFTTPFPPEFQTNRQSILHQTPPLPTYNLASSSTWRHTKAQTSQIDPSGQTLAHFLTPKLIKDCFAPEALLFLIPYVVMHLRLQRDHMVQGSAQFSFIATFINFVLSHYAKHVVSWLQRYNLNDRRM